LQIVQSLNILNRTVSGITSKVEECVLASANQYDGTVAAYFEIVATNDNASPQTVDLDAGSNWAHGSSSQAASITVPGSISTPTRYRSTSFTLGLGSSYYFHRFQPNSADLTIYAARIVIVQSGTITDTSSQFEIGLYEEVGSALYENVYASFSNLKPWRYEAAKFDPAGTFYFEATAMPENYMGEVTIALFVDDGDYGNWSLVSATEINLTPGTASHYISSAFTPIDGRHLTRVP